LEVNTMSQKEIRDPLLPHPVLRNYYDTSEARPAFVRALFDRTAVDYDGLNRLFSLGSGARYRTEVLKRAGVGPGAQLLDVATGTGLVAAEARRLVGVRGGVVGVDVSAGMLQVARKQSGLLLAQGRAEALPFADARFDVLTMGYALRHVGSLTGTFREFHRVLKPGGRVVLLEIARPENRIALGFARLYLGRIIPGLARLARTGAQARLLMRYYWDTIESCVPPTVILAALAESGLVEAASETDFGLFRTYTARRPG
jgi:demethylmenaquinone methyltransferase / 2-methoxy-6-polyprenyl-1,4-benzoquinol methylase